jgi:hypothetical protein
MDPVIQYILLFGITIVITIVGLSRDSITFHLLAAISWFATALGHLMIGETTSPLTWALGFLYVGIGLTFTLSTLDKTLGFLRGQKQDSWNRGGWD